MKIKYQKFSLALLIVLAIRLSAIAQTTISNTHLNSNWKGNTYELILKNDQLTELYVDGKKIPAAQWSRYNGAIAHFRQQIKLDRIQAKKDQVQARLDQQQALKDQAQAELDQQQAQRDQEQARRDQVQAQQDQVQAQKDQEEAKKAQAEAAQDKIQADKDREQARLDQIQAGKDREQAAEDRKLMQQLTAELVTDKIIPDSQSLHELQFNSDGLFVNGVKQPDNIYQKYKEKYARISGSSFSYSK